MDAKMPDQELELRFDPHTVEHLGSQMYSRLPNAVAELVANAYDADASEVSVTVMGPAGEQIIIVHDDGHGMNLDDLQNKYLQIGRNRRRIEGADAPTDFSENGRRRVSGKKGIGKLALFGIGDEVRVQTKRRDETTQFEITLNYQHMLSTGEKVYRPKLEVVADAEMNDPGTTIRLSGLRRTSRIDADGLANSLSRLFNYNEAGDDPFVVTVRRDDGKRYSVNRDRRIKSIDTDYTWQIPNDLPKEIADLIRKHDISGTVVSSRTTLPESQRGITTFVRGRLANEPEFYGASSTSFAFSYLTGFVDIDKIDDLGPDLIASDRRSINWESGETAEIRDDLGKAITWIGQDRRRRQKESKASRVKKSRNIDIGKWPETIRTSEAKPLESLLDGIVEDDSISDSRLESIVEDLEVIVPEYAPLYWRHLHEDVQEEVKSFYEHEDYFKALEQALMLYVDLVRDRSGSVAPELNMMQQVFKEEAPIIDVSARFEPFLPQDSSRNLNRSQKTLSEGILAGFRNLIAHHRQRVLINEGIFSDSDCLDALGMISYLYSRVKALDGVESTEGAGDECNGSEAHD